MVQWWLPASRRVDRTKYQIQIPLPPKIDPTVGRPPPCGVVASAQKIQSFTKQSSQGAMVTV